MDPAHLARELEEFLATAPRACVLEDGETTFDLTAAKYSVAGDTGKCLLHLWSQERNAVRRVVDLERKNGQLNLAIQRFGKGKASWIEIIADRERRLPAVQKQARLQYQRLLGRALQRSFPDWNIEELVSTADLEHSFSSVYSRGLLRRGRSSFCVFGSRLCHKVGGASLSSEESWGIWFSSPRSPDRPIPSLL